MPSIHLHVILEQCTSRRIAASGKAAPIRDSFKNSEWRATAFADSWKLIPARTRPEPFEGDIQRLGETVSLANATFRGTCKVASAATEGAIGMGRYALVFLSLILSVSVSASAQSPAPDAPVLTKLLNEFLAGAGGNDASVHDRFWADDLIYTSSSGQRFGKADVMREIRAAPAPKPDDPKTVYSAEDIRIHQYGDTAVVAFRLVATTAKAGATETANYLNTGTFLKRDGRWQAVSWQATIVPKPGDEARKAQEQSH